MNPDPNSLRSWVDQMMAIVSGDRGASVTVCPAARDSVRRELRAADLWFVEVIASEYVRPTRAIVSIRGTRWDVPLNPLHLVELINENV